jgi:hypothetical protein
MFCYLMSTNLAHLLLNLLICILCFGAIINGIVCYLILKYTLPVYRNIISLHILPYVLNPCDCLLILAATF